MFVIAVAVFISVVSFCCCFDVVFFSCCCCLLVGLLLLLILLLFFLFLLFLLFVVVVVVVVVVAFALPAMYDEGDITGECSFLLVTLTVTTPISARGCCPLSWALTTS